MIVLSIQFQVPGHRRKDFLDASKLVVGPTRVAPGCVNCQFYQSIENPDSALLLEEWQSREALDRYLGSEQFRIILSLMDISTSAPIIKINTIAKTEGLEALLAENNPA